MGDPSTVFESIFNEVVQGLDGMGFAVIFPGGKVERGNILTVNNSIEENVNYILIEKESTTMNFAPGQHITIRHEGKADTTWVVRSEILYSGCHWFVRVLRNGEPKVISDNTIRYYHDATFKEYFLERVAEPVVQNVRHEQQNQGQNQSLQQEFGFANLAREKNKKALNALEEIQELQRCNELLMMDHQELQRRFSASSTRLLELEQQNDFLQEQYQELQRRFNESDMQELEKQIDFLRNDRLSLQRQLAVANFAYVETSRAFFGALKKKKELEKQNKSLQEQNERLQDEGQELEQRLQTRESNLQQQWISQYLEHISGLKQYPG